MAGPGSRIGCIKRTRGRPPVLTAAAPAGIPSSRIQTQLLCDGLQRVADELHVLVEGYAKDFGSGRELFPVNAPRESLVLHLLADRARLDRAQRLVWLDQGAGDDESAHLIDRV